MNTTTRSTITRSTITRSTVTALVTIAALSWTTGTADASTPRGPDAHARVSTAPFAELINALHGRSLAQYVAEHMEHRLG